MLHTPLHPIYINFGGTHEQIAHRLQPGSLDSRDAVVKKYHVVLVGRLNPETLAHRSHPGSLDSRDTAEKNRVRLVGRLTPETFANLKA